MTIHNEMFDLGPRNTSKLISARVVGVVNAVVLIGRERLRKNLEGLGNDFELGNVVGEGVMLHVGVVDHLEVDQFWFQGQLLLDFARRFDQFARIHLKKKIENGKQIEAKKSSCNQQ
jgi:hypothetical protein